MGKTCERLCYGILTFLVLLGCSRAAPARPGDDKPRAGMPADIVRDVLPQLAKGHADKVQLSGFVAMPLIHKVDGPVRKFTDKMGVQQKELLKELKDWAKAHGVSLKFEYADDVNGRAQKAADDLQSKALQQAGGDSFELLVLVLEYSDFCWQRSLLKTTLEEHKDLAPHLKSYLERSLAVHEEGIKEIEGLLKRFHMK